MLRRGGDQIGIAPRDSLHPLPAEADALLLEAKTGKQCHDDGNDDQYDQQREGIVAVPMRRQAA